MKKPEYVGVYACILASEIAIPIIMGCGAVGVTTVCGWLAMAA